MASMKRAAMVLLAGVTLVVSACGAESDDSGLPAHCGNKSSTSFTSAASGSQTPPKDAASFEGVVQDWVAQQFPRLTVSFPSGAPGDLSDDTKSDHPLQEVDTTNGRTASLRNANGVELLKVGAVNQDGTWFVESADVCSDLRKKFGDTGD